MVACNDYRIDTLDGRNEDQFIADFIQDHPLRFHMDRIAAIQNELKQQQGNLMAKVFLRRTGAVRDNDGNYIINSKDLFAWFESASYLNIVSHYDIL